MAHEFNIKVALTPSEGVLSQQGSMAQRLSVLCLARIPLSSSGGLSLKVNLLILVPVLSGFPFFLFDVA